MKRKPASRENSIIIGTILASGIVFVFGFFLGRAWVMIPQEQVNGYQKKSGAPVVLTEEKSETLILPRKKLHEKIIIKEKPIGNIKLQKQQEIAQKPAILPKKQQMIVQTQSIEHGTQNTEQKQVSLQTVQKPPVSQQKQQKLAQKLAIFLQKQKQEAAAQKLAMSILQTPQKQQMVVQKKGTGRKQVIPQPQAAQKSVAAPQKQPQQNPTPQKAEGRFALQLGSFSDEAKASALVANLSVKGYSAYKLKIEMGEKGTWYRVYISGVFSSREDAQQKGDALKSLGVISNYFVITSK